MEMDFESDEITDFTTVPAGTYACEIVEVRTGTTRSGDERWAVRLAIIEGEYAGRLAAWDGLVFSARGLARVRRVLGVLGLPNRGKVTLEPKDLEGRRALIDVRASEYTHPSGELVRRNEVPYDGYRPLEESASGRTGGEGPPTEANVPF